jgi:methyltransferase (TIGR00027 family)
MEGNHFSKTAMGTAFMRAYHHAHDQPKIFDDFLAHCLLTAEERRESEDRHLRSFRIFDPARFAACPDRDNALASWMQTGAAPPIVFARARYAEDHLEEAFREQGVKQYVILGAGLDTFAWRRRDLVAQLPVFEVDHPATQNFKRQRLPWLGLKQPARLHFVPVDFSREDLATALRRSSYDPQTRSFFSWLGVTYYLSREALFSIFGAIAQIAPAGSAVIFDYLEASAFVPGRVARRVEFMMEIVQHLGEPMIMGFDPAGLAADLEGVGLRLQEDLGPDEIQERFFAGRPDDYHACEHVHYAWAVVK